MSSQFVLMKEAPVDLPNGVLILFYIVRGLAFPLLRSFVTYLSALWWISIDSLNTATINTIDINARVIAGYPVSNI